MQTGWYGIPGSHYFHSSTKVHIVDDNGPREIAMDTREAGRRGGKATAAKRTPKERKEIARRAARIRWKRQKEREYLTDSIKKD